MLAYVSIDAVLERKLIAIAELLIYQNALHGTQKRKVGVHFTLSLTAEMQQQGKQNKKALIYRAVAGRLLILQYYMQ